MIIHLRSDLRAAAAGWTELRPHLDCLTDGGHPVASGGGGSDDGVGHARTSGGVLGGAARVRPAGCAVLRGRGRGGVGLAVGLVVGAKGAVGGGQGGALALGTDHSRDPLQAEGLQLLTRTVGEAVWDLGLWPDLGGDGRGRELQNFEPDRYGSCCPITAQTRGHWPTVAPPAGHVRDAGFT